MALFSLKVATRTPIWGRDTWKYSRILRRVALVRQPLPRTSGGGGQKTLILYIIISRTSTEGGQKTHILYIILRLGAPKKISRGGSILGQKHNIEQKCIDIEYYGQGIGSKIDFPRYIIAKKCLDVIVSIS